MLVVAISCATGGMTYIGICEAVDWKYTIALLGGFVILLILLRSNLWISCGLHSVWNFVLYGVIGLNVSGEQANEMGIFSFVVNGSNVFNGGIYGVEVSIITTIVLGTMVALCYKKLNK